MVIQPWATAKWPNWTAGGHGFGVLSVDGLPRQAPVPDHFTPEVDTVLLHSTRHNSAWRVVRAAPDITLTVPALPCVPAHRA